MMLTTMAIVVVDISAEFSIVANFILFVCVTNLASRQRLVCDKDIGAVHPSAISSTL